MDSSVDLHLLFRILLAAMYMIPRMRGACEREMDV